MRHLICFSVFFFSMTIFALNGHSSENFQRLFEKELSKEVDVRSPLGIPKVITIVLDPGHGGKDTGAIGVNGIKEKTVVLAIAKKLAQQIKKQKNIRVVLTRSGDYFIPLRERLRIARKNNADLFIAIHADAHFDKEAEGVSVYALSERGATSEAARWLAQRENHSELDEVELDELQDDSKQLRAVLIDLAQTATIRDSVNLGAQVLSALDDISSLHYREVEQAPFVVLKSPDIPSILVETGFITNFKEEARLKSPAYQQKIANALWQGIDKYIIKYRLQAKDPKILSATDFPFIVRHQPLALRS